ncbi:MAG: cobalt-precorrin-7 (C(5))-methyltransferase, partial [Pseudonocardiaceae bacterium]
MSVTVVGLDGDTLPPGAAQALASAQVVVGAPHQLAAVPVPGDAAVLGPSELDELTGASPVVVLASGDPGFFGIVRALRKRGLRPVVLPARASVARAFALLGRSWDDVAVVSAHGRSLR